MTTCKGCDKKAKYGTCEVCRLVDGITDQRQVVWCGLCNALICVKCKKNYPKRAIAAMLSKVESYKR